MKEGHTMEYNKLKEILDLHKKWLNGDIDGKRAILWSENLQDADLQGADLRNADLWGADLQGADLWNADLQGVCLQNANLRKAYLYGANLQNANLRDADLRGANLHKAKNLPDLSWTSIVPECGSFIGWKKVGKFIIKLKILESAKRSNATGRKCRCSAAEVLEIQYLDGTKAGFNKIHNNSFCGADYIVGEIVTPDSFDDDRWNECSHGIHFFITRQEAVDYA